MSIIYSWRTKKTPEGYQGRVIKIEPSSTQLPNGTYAKVDCIAQKTFATRARAKGWAQRRAKAERMKI